MDLMASLPTLSSSEKIQKRFFITSLSAWTDSESEEMNFDSNHASVEKNAEERGRRGDGWVGGGQMILWMLMTWRMMIFRKMMSFEGDTFLLDELGSTSRSESFVSVSGSSKIFEESPTISQLEA